MSMGILNTSDEESTLNPKIPEESPLVSDLVGQAKDFVDEITLNIQGEEVFNGLGVSPYKVFVLDGPPGVGKTLAVNVLNNTFNRNLISRVLESGDEERAGLVKTLETSDKSKLDLGDFSLLMFEYNIGEQGTAYINLSSRKAHNFFEKASFYASYGIPTVLVFDEADALLGSRKSSIQTHSEDRKLLETIMKDMQIAHDSPRIYMILMSNLPESIDQAVLRAGRVDKHYHFSLPSFDERKIAFERAISRRNDAVGYKIIRKYDPEILAEMSEGFNYADIFQSVEGAVREKVKSLLLNKGKKKGIIQMGYLTQQSLESSVRNHNSQFRQDKYQIGFKQ